MKKSIIYRLSFVIIFGLGLIFSHESKAVPNHGISFQVFYNELSPYGDWVMDPSFGYVWVPFVEQGFHPYGTNGYWEMTNFGNTWVSNYQWGWAPFHYGRWFRTDYYGWAWVPGYEWGPAWVNWRTGGGYYGWAPLSPGFHVNVGFNVPSNYWVFVSQRRFRARNFYRYYAPSYYVSNIYNRTTVINNTYVYNNTTYNTGPSRREIERSTRTTVPVYQVSDSARPGRTVVQNDRISVYRPEVRESNGRSENSRPSRVFTAEEYKERSTMGNRPSASSPRSVQNQSSRGSEGQATAVRESNRNNGINTNSGVIESATPSRNTQTSDRNRSLDQVQPRVQQNPEKARTVEQRSRNSSPSVSNGNSRTGQAAQSPKPDVSRTIENTQRRVESTGQQTNQRTQQEITKPAQSRQAAPQEVKPRLQEKPQESPASRSSSGSRSATAPRGGRGGN
ncbi:hypothetical protein M3O96_04235 [Aquiflexum sp. TKW24L]|uniref:DUF6600 domain-containing protein n=1 Tax=Aquiflexum sp. TKW24L TaxID=2942212 RepID=UPI0020BD4B50|nr:DUF6600 domain-containing protein [Aquiflexum sp. TKW24L]MCL6258282.1 hypothetical protein [Aquiflexum sp. TKW24L]